MWQNVSSSYVFWNGVSTQTPACNSKVALVVFPMSVYVLILQSEFVNCNVKVTKMFFITLKYCVLSVLFHCLLFFTQIFLHICHCFLPLKLHKCHIVVLTTYYMSGKSLDIYFFYCLGVSPSGTSLSLPLICNINIFVKLSLFSAFTVKSLSHSHVCY